jgi:type IX secretion system PorP/SprF family membrane protein
MIKPEQFNNSKMKKIIIILLILMPIAVSGQQFPFMEGYNVNPINISPSYAGIYNNKTLFIDYRSDWSGIEGGPKTSQLSYSDKFKNKVGLGGRFIYDKTDIFKQTLLLGTYTYEINVSEGHTLNLGLSLGFYRNSIDLSKYYNNPSYVQDLVLLYGLQKSKIKFATDISALYRYKQGEAGILFSNIMFGTAKYPNSDLTYKPFKNYLLHASYLFTLDDKLTIKPTFIFRGGQHVPVLFEISPVLTWDNRFWATVLMRTSGIFGIGLGGEIYKGILLNYTYDFSSAVNSSAPISAFASHQLTLGLRIFSFLKK